MRVLRGDHSAASRTVRNIVVWLLILSLPVAVFLNVQQSFRFYQLEREIAALEARQLELFEANKRAIAGIAVLRSPARIRRVVEDAELPVLPLTPEQIIHVRVFSNANSANGLNSSDGSNGSNSLNSAAGSAGESGAGGANE